MALSTGQDGIEIDYQKAKDEVDDDHFNESKVCRDIAIYKEDFLSGFRLLGKGTVAER